jgi:hypothetical protein
MKIKSHDMIQNNLSRTIQLSGLWTLPGLMDSRALREVLRGNEVHGGRA